MMASLLVLVERSREERASRLMRGRDAIVMDDMFGVLLENSGNGYCLSEGSVGSVFVSKISM